jgi:hypothetical protein
VAADVGLSASRGSFIRAGGVVAKTFADLTDVQKQKFEAQLAALGLSPRDVPAKVTTDGMKGIHALDASRSSLKMQPLTVQSLADFKRLGGIPDDRYTVQGHSDAHITYPAPLPENRMRLLKAAGVRDSLHRALAADEQRTLDTAMQAFVNGDSSKVPSDLVNLVEARHFPIQAAVGGAQDLVIDKPYVIAGPGPVALVFGTITIKPGGYIVCQCEAKISAQVITNES